MCLKATEFQSEICKPNKSSRFKNYDHGKLARKLCFLKSEQIFWSVYSIIFIYSMSARMRQIIHGTYNESDRKRNRKKNTVSQQIQLRNKNEIQKEREGEGEKKKYIREKHIIQLHKVRKKKKIKEEEEKKLPLCTVNNRLP